MKSIVLLTAFLTFSFQTFAGPDKYSGFERKEWDCTQKKNKNVTGVFLQHPASFQFQLIDNTNPKTVVRQFIVTAISAGLGNFLMLEVFTCRGIENARLTAFSEAAFIRMEDSEGTYSPIMDGGDSGLPLITYRMGFLWMGDVYHCVGR